MNTKVFNLSYKMALILSSIPTQHISSMEQPNNKQPEEYQALKKHKMEINNEIYFFLTQFLMQDKPFEYENVEDYAGFLMKAPAFTQYPEKNGEEVEFTMHLESTPIEIENKKADPYGFKKRNIALNAQTPITIPERQAMPFSLPHPNLSLFESSNPKILRASVLEWLNLRYRNKLDIPLNNSTAIEFIRGNNITYESIWFWDQTSYLAFKKRGGKLDFDEMGRPINPYPNGKKINIKDRGFYFFYGENPSVDPLITVEINGKIYALLIQRNNVNNQPQIKGDNAPLELAFPGGMIDIDKDSQPLHHALRELKEETGIELDSAKVTPRKILVSHDVVKGESRTTRNAWTTSYFYHLHFNSIEELADCTISTTSEFDKGEVSKVLFLDIRYILAHYVMPQQLTNIGNDLKGSFFASHGKMFAQAMAKFFNEHTNKINYLQLPYNERYNDLNYNNYRLKPIKIKELINEIK